MLTDHSRLEMTFLTPKKTSELEELRFDVEDMTMRRNTPTIDIAAMRKSSAYCLVKTVKLDGTVRRDIQTQAPRRHTESESIDRLVTAGARATMVRPFFDVTKSGSLTRRRWLNITLRGRRKQRPVLNDVNPRIFLYCKRDRHKYTAQCPARLNTAKLTDTPESEVWQLLHRAEIRGAFEWAA